MDPIAKQSTKDSLHGDSAGSDGGSINSCPTEVTSSSSSGIRTNDPANLLTEQKPRTRIKFSALDLPDEELGEFKKSRKRMQNRVSAMKCREKQKTYTTTLESKNQKLADENGKLSLENASLKAENGLLRRQIAFFESMMSNFPMMRKREPQQFGDMESMGYPAMKASGGFNDGWAPTNADDGNGDYKAYMSSGSGFGNSSFMFVVAFICIYMVVSAFDDSSAINPDWTNSNRHLSFNDSTATSAPTNGSFGSNLMMSLVGTALLGGLFVGYKTYKSYSKSS